MTELVVVTVLALLLVGLVWLYGANREAGWDHAQPELLAVCAVLVLLIGLCMENGAAT
jgi:hypothetical protein